MEMTITRLFKENEGNEATAFMAATKGTMTAEGSVYVVTCSASAAAKVAAVAVADKAGKTGAAAITNTGKAAALAVNVGIATTKVAVASAAPIGVAAVTGVLKVGAEAVNASAKVVNEVKTTWKKDASVVEAKKEIKGAYDSVKNSVPKEFSFFGVTIRR